VRDLLVPSRANVVRSGSGLDGFDGLRDMGLDPARRRLIPLILGSNPKRPTLVMRTL